MTRMTMDEADALRTSQSSPEYSLLHRGLSPHRAPADGDFHPTTSELAQLLDSVIAGPKAGEHSEAALPPVAGTTQVLAVVTEQGAAAVPEPDDPLTTEDDRNLKAVMGYEVADNTRTNYRAQWQRFAAWARAKAVSALPADPRQVAVYLAERFERYSHKPATLRAAAAAISHTHKAAGLDDPCKTEQVRAVLKSATCRAGSFQRQAEGLTAQALEAVCATACQPRRGRGGKFELPDMAARRGRMDIAMISLMRDAMLRVSEAASLRWEDLKTEPDGTGRLLIRRSKTDRGGATALTFVSIPTMERLASLREGVSGADSMFGLRPNQIARRIKQAANFAGLGDGFSGHSPRVGMACDLARSGTELPRLMTAGRWRSPRMPALYTRNESVARGAVAQYYTGDYPSPPV